MNNSRRMPLKGQVLEDDSEALWAGQDVADDDSENQQKRLRKLNYLAKKCKTLKIDYAILDRLCESEQRSRRHPESSGAALILALLACTRAALHRLDWGGSEGPSPGL